MTEETWKIVNDARSQGISVSDREAKEVYDLCQRKMEIAEIEDKEEYMPLLYFDELLNYVFRRTINAKTWLMMHTEQSKEVANG